MYVRSQRRRRGVGDEYDPETGMTVYAYEGGGTSQFEFEEQAAYQAAGVDQYAGYREYDGLWYPPGVTPGASGAGVQTRTGQVFASIEDAIAAGVVRLTAPQGAATGSTMTAWFQKNQTAILIGIMAIAALALATGGRRR